MAVVSGLGSLRSLFVQFWGTNIFIRNKMMNDENVEMKPDVRMFYFLVFTAIPGPQCRWEEEEEVQPLG